MTKLVAGWQFLYGKKTYIIAIAAIAYAWLGVSLQHIDVQSAIKMTEEALLAMGIRHGLKTGA